MTIDAVSRLELLVDLFEQKASRLEDYSTLRLESERNSRFSPPMAESRAQTLTLAEMLGARSTLLAAFGRSLQGKDESLHVAVNRIAHFLSESADTINEDAPRTPRLLHYVYPIV